MPSRRSLRFLACCLPFTAWMVADYLRWHRQGGYLHIGR